jgi:hypothetical protein
MPKPRATHKARHLCQTKFCRNPAAKGRRLCHTCKQAGWREAHPRRAAWRAIKDKAVARGIEFAISFEDFCLAVEGTGYVDGRGVHREHLHLDRIDATKGYTLENIRVLGAGENVAKGNRERRLPEHVRHMIERQWVIGSRPTSDVDGGGGSGVDYDPSPDVDDEPPGEPGECPF